MRLYDFHESGNGYKVRMLLSHLGISYERTLLRRRPLLDRRHRPLRVHARGRRRGL